MPEQPYARFGLAIVRLTIGAMFVGVFFENLGKGLYTPSGYAGLINYYIQHDHAPAIWKAIMATAASHSAMAAPLQGSDRNFARRAASSSAFSRALPASSLLGYSRAYGCRSGARRGSGNCWFRHWQHWGSQWEGRAGRGGLMRFWHGGARTRFGGKANGTDGAGWRLLASLGHYSHAQ